ncbi:putative quinol monooxygenase [Parvibaculaceae bacterium PLY_AMNH_Bact1]|nr:putative quinol monooxygenase [Parvibaculaceae bacterium PLY_AMNH_Bact1]
MIVITGQAAIAADKIDAFRPVAERQVTLSRKEEGCLNYGYYEDAMAPGTFLFYEEWKDQAAVDFHFAQAYCLEFMTAAGELSSTPPKVNIHQVANTQVIG